VRPGGSCGSTAAARGTTAAAALMLAAWPALCAGAVGAAEGAAAPGVATASPSSATLDELLRLLAAHRHGHVRFTEVEYLKLLDRPLESTGELLYEAPDRLEKRTLTPKVETLLLERGVLSARRGRHTYVLPEHDYPQVVPFIESIRATLAGDRATLERWFQLQFEGELSHWSLRLLPRDPSLAAVVTDIRICGERDAVRTVEIRQSDGDRSLLTVGAEVSP
jgi:Outer membrane lipoprotein carrier protein LolA-like